MADRRRVRVDTGEPVARPDFSFTAEAPEEALGEEGPILAPPLCNCPRLERDEWHEAVNDWSDITLVKTWIMAAMGVPLRYNKVYGSLAARAKSLGATVPEDAMMLLGKGKFRRPVMLEVEGTQLDAKGVVRPGGVAFTRLTPAPPGAIKGALADAVKAARIAVGRDPDETWLWYLTCRVCSAERDFETLIVAHYR